MNTIESAAAALASGATTSRALFEDCLARIRDPLGEGSRVFLAVHEAQARATADAMDHLRKAGRAPSPYAGIPISVKDLFDIEGTPTPAGSVVLRTAKPAARTAPSVARLMAAGFVVMGRTNMTEFAFSGLGLNPHYETPRSPWDRATGRMPGGSSSGAAVSISDGMALAALGTDTGGSCRVPAAMCGVVGYKPTARRVPLAGVLPLSPSLDSVGPLANSVACCAVIDAIMAGETPVPLAPLSLSGLRIGLPANLVLEGMDRSVASSYAASLAVLEAAGARLVETSFPALDEIAKANAKGGLTAAEAFAWHRVLLAEHADRYDPFVRARLERGAGMTASDYIETLDARARICAQMNRQTQDFDILAMPTCPLIPQPIAKLADIAEANRVNQLQLRNTATGNFLDRCAISLPCHAEGEPPVGLMLMGETMGDPKLLRIAQSIATALRG